MKNMMISFFSITLLIMILSGCIAKERDIDDNKLECGIVGWNLGNTLDNIDYKRSGNTRSSVTLWGNPVQQKK